ncbi:FGGY-family carbohydrate kinase [Embleya sp. NBC_00896]|uniref:FGGY-family carbohydrate kinase n=1 Tax=Embleya sp. NBC_00896 TaxID=2975961 RepID=UPI0038659C6C|nr:FGGY-family carbohydrate kinase [Embleya sp. NBC_00896]
MPTSSTPTLVAGVHCSARQLRILVCDAATGTPLRQGRAAYAEGAATTPGAWLRAFGEAAAGGLLDGVAAIGVAAQNHGAVPLDGQGVVLTHPLPDDDHGASGAAADLVDSLGGPAAWTAATGSVPGSSSAIAQLRRFARFEPDAVARIASVLLPHDWVTWQLLGCPPDAVTDRADASTTGYYATTGEWREDLLHLAIGRVPRTPIVLPPGSAAGRTPEGVLVSAGTGSEAALALGAGLADGDVVVALGTTATAFTPHPVSVVDPTGVVGSYADATGRYLPLVRTLNAARVLRGTAAMLGLDADEFDRAALESTPGASGLVLLPYLDGEHIPDLPHAAGTLTGLRQESMTPSALARATVEGTLCGLSDALDVLRDRDIAVERLILVGPGARSAAVEAIAPALLGLPTAVPSAALAGRHVAQGAARQAAWALFGVLPAWPSGVGEFIEPDEDALALGDAVRAQYREVRDRLHPGAVAPPREGVEAGGRHRRG